MCILMVYLDFNKVCSKTTVCLPICPALVIEELDQRLEKFKQAMLKERSASPESRIIIAMIAIMHI